MLGGGILFGAIIGETIRVVESRNPQAKFMKEKLNDLKGYLAEKAFPVVLKKEAKVAYTYFIKRNNNIDILIKSMRKQFIDMRSDFAE